MLVISGARVHAQDPNVEFVEALREAGWHDTAAAYVEWVATSPLNTEAFNRQLPLERATSLAAAGRASRDPKERAEFLSRAAESFTQFASGDPDSPEALDATRQAASLYAELALKTLAGAEGMSDVALDAARETALSQFDRAAELATQLLDSCTAQLAALPKPVVAMADPDMKAQRDKLTGRQSEARFLLALVAFHRAEAYEPGSAEHSDALDDAWDQFGKLVEMYDKSSMAWATSRLYQGRSAQQQGEFSKAQGCFEDVMETRPDGSPERRALSARACRHNAECLIALDKPNDAIRVCKTFLAETQPAEREQPAWLEVAYQLAQAYEKTLKDKGTTQGAAKRTETEMRELLRAVAANPNDFQFDARLALAASLRDENGAAKFKTFAAALEAGKTSLELMNSTLVAARVARENNPDAVEGLQRDAEASKQEAFRAFEAAVALADKQTPIAEVNVARYYLAWLMWEAGRIEEAAVLGEFVATRYPESEFGASSAKVALAAWEKLYQQSRSEEPEAAPSSTPTAPPAGAFAAAKLAELAQLIATRWPAAPEASAAINILINVALRENRTDEAEALLAKLPPDARASAELSLGTALWTKYLQASSTNANEFDEATAKLRDKAGALLASGFAAAQATGKPTASGAVGGLYYVQFLLARGDAAAARAVLEDKTVGPLTLVEAKNESATRPEFVIETYMAALRVYVAAQPPDRERAQAMMTALEKFVAEQGAASADERVTKVYVRLGLQLAQQLKSLTANGKQAEAQQLAAAFGDLLVRISGRLTASDWAIQNWIAQTNLQIGQTLTGPTALEYTTRARTAYEAVLAAAAKGGEGAPDANVVLGVRKRMGDCLIAAGEFQAGIEQYVELLRDKPNTLDLQQTATAAYQAWGREKRISGPLTQAIHGAIPQPDGKTLVWGWLRISQAAEGERRRAAAAGAADPESAQKVARFNDLFFEARFNAAQSRFLAATFAPPANRRAELTAAKQNVDSMRAGYPDLGGPKWKAAFEALLLQITQELAKP